MFIRGLPTSSLRTFSKSAARTCRFKDISSIPLSVPLGNHEHSKSSEAVPYEPFNATLSKLDSGIRIASEPHYGEYCTIGVAIESGARYEAGYPLGTSHLIEKLAYGSSSKHQSRDEIYSVLENNGGLIDCQSTRDTFIYAASCQKSGLDSVLEILANALWRPCITKEEFEEAQAIVQYENEDMSRKIECEPLLTDWIHSAAFQGNTLGFSKFTDSSNVNSITREHVFSFMSQYHAPSRLVVAGIGVDHDELVAAVRRHFRDNDTTWHRDPKLLLPKLPEVDHSLAQYTGGEMRIKKDLSEHAIGTPYPNLAHVSLGFEGVGYRDKDFVSFCVLQSLMGGGGSFSAGGPGKGMYTRLYTDVMNRYHWIYSATAFNHSYADAGLFCIHGSAPPEGVSTDICPLLVVATITALLLCSPINLLLMVLLDQFIQLRRGIEEEELKRAKIQLKSQLMMNLEIRPVMFEDLARQVIGHGYRRTPEEYMAQIDTVTEKDVVRVAERMLAGRPSLVGYGDIDELATMKLLDDAVAQQNVEVLRKKTKMFGF